jgi:divalent metal cation (Fe/Co/Zn/Cd) transporter
MNEAGPTGKIALVAAILSIVSKEIMYRATAVVAQRTESQVLLANAWHHRSDAFSSVVALFSIWGATAGGIPALDPLGGLFVAGMVGITGLRVGWSAFKQLTDTQDFELKAAVERAVEKSIRQYKLQDDVVGYDVKARFLGSRAWVDLEVETNPSRTTSAATQVIKVLRSAILSSIPSVTDVAVLLQAKQDPEVVEVKGDASESPTVTPRQVEANVRKALRNSSAFQGADGAKRLREISSVMTHFSASSTACDVDIIVSADEDSNLSVSEAKKLANIVKDDVIQHADGVVDAKVSLELVRKQEERVSGPEQHYSSDISATLR